MKKTLAFIMVLFCVVQLVTAQNTSIKYGAIGQVGLLNGEAGEELSLQLINGVAKGKWFAGMGVGIDYYNDRSVPVFIDLRRDLSASKNTPFVYADGGINYSWLTKVQKNNKGPREFENGGYYDVGIGWKLKGNSSRAFLASVGYSYKQMKETATANQWWPITSQLNESTEYYNNTFKRIVVRVGFQL